MATQFCDVYGAPERIHTHK